VSRLGWSPVQDGAAHFTMHNQVIYSLLSGLETVERQFLICFVEEDGGMDGCIVGALVQFDSRSALGLLLSIGIVTKQSLA